MSKKRKPKLPDEQALTVYGFYPKNAKQELLSDLIENKEIIIAAGSSGVGKTYVALAKALSLLDRGYDKIVLIKSVTTIPGESIGYIPGDYEEKMKPFLMSYYGNIDKICGKNCSEDLIKKGLIEILPIAYIRGLSIDNSIVIIDESQNLSTHSFKTIITRIGNNSKYIFLGDIEQIDRKVKQESCLETVLNIFEDNEHIGTVKFDDSDCVRNPIIPKILEELRKNGI